MFGGLDTTLRRRARPQRRAPRLTPSAPMRPVALHTVFEALAYGSVFACSCATAGGHGCPRRSSDGDHAASRSASAPSSARRSAPSWRSGSRTRSRVRELPRTAAPAGGQVDRRRLARRPDRRRAGQEDRGRAPIEWRRLRAPDRRWACDRRGGLFSCRTWPTTPHGTATRLPWGVDFGNGIRSSSRPAVRDRVSAHAIRVDPLPAARDFALESPAPVFCLPSRISSSCRRKQLSFTACS